MIVVSPATLLAQERVSDTVHNLSVSGPGSVRAESESQVCIFCHAPHNTNGVRPLWNRDLPTTSYTIYQSSTLDALPGQPTGSSKLCLSCHDGTIALGNVLSRADQLRMISGDFIPAGMNNLRTDLSDDHPISFAYTSGLAAADRQLVAPVALPSEIRLDGEGRLQCTSCHDPHRNVYDKFLVMRREYGTLCTACHLMEGWQLTSHRTSNAPTSANPEADWPFSTVAENACRSCHRPHGAARHERLQIFELEEENCLSCHDGRVAHANIRGEIDKLSAHDPRRYDGRHDPVEIDAGANPHVECADCHNPHSTTPVSQRGGNDPIGPTLLNVPGVTIGGTLVRPARNEYEVCLRCHGDEAVPISGRISRQAETDNFRLKFSAGNPSFHPVVMSSPGDDSPSLVPGLARGDLIRCTSCHNNDEGPGAGGMGPDGPHGSTFEFLLERNYSTLDDTAESEYAYALCYKCHQQSSILADQSFPLHKKHIVDARTPCSACHDPHGVSTTVGGSGSHTHLINFDTTIVRPLPENGRLEFRQQGRLAGTCTLVCHGVRHEDEGYED